MFAPKMTPYFDTPTRLSANPHFYDYLHCLDLEPDGSVKMIDGGGQVINFESRGKYRISQSNASFDMHFSDLVETDPYEDDKIIGKLEDFSINCQ